MNKFLATVRVKGQSVRTIVFAESSLHARLILEFQFGIGNVIGTPSIAPKTTEGYTPLAEVIAATKPIKPIKPLSPQQTRIDSLVRQKDAISNSLKAERDRQKVAKAQHQIFNVTTKKTAA
jgi:hypothetical protein